MSRRVCLLLVVLALTAGFPPHVSAQTAQGVTAARAAADRAWRAGRLDEIDRLAQAFPSDAALTVWRSRAMAARGEYARAESIIQTLAAANPAGDAALEAGLLQQLGGRRTEARRALQLVMLGVPRSPTARDLLRAARAARALGRIDDAQAFFQEAIALAPNDLLINTAWGELFVEKYGYGEAARSFEIALKADPDYGPALLGMATALDDSNPARAMGYAERALKVNPIDAGAHLFLAQHAIYQDKKKDARESIGRVLATNPRHLEALSMLAGLAYVEGQDQEYQNTIAAALRIHPSYGEIHRVVGSITARYYRFDEAVDHVRKAIALDRENIRAQADLGGTSSDARG